MGKNKLDKKIKKTFERYLEYKEEEGEEAIEVDKKNQKLLKNQFNFSERATQTLNPSHRVKQHNNSLLF